jgi:hypothetical protein
MFIGPKARNSSRRKSSRIAGRKYAPLRELLNTSGAGLGRNRCNGENGSEVSSNAPQDVGMHGKETSETAKKGRVEAIGRDGVGS